ncbi:hypothetical protein PY479_12240 [Shewanella sp. A32]|uniref:hypothetical protein n=1 Tax=Shewanella sp. A32 TaxID=3031327 RepID=UPI0023BA02E8|nr:hypothetical protein [Shewanella sp. A32]MDF0535042.1 hypothetical protein [Shewanella sp. A32]
MKYFLFALVLLSGMTGCTQVPEWTLFYYSGHQQVPQPAHHYEAISGYYETLAQCQAKGQGLQQLADTPAVFQCAHRCRLDEANVVTCDLWHTFTPEH